MCVWKKEIFYSFFFREREREKKDLLVSFLDSNSHIALLFSFFSEGIKRDDIFPFVRPNLKGTKVTWCERQKRKLRFLRKEAIILVELLLLFFFFRGKKEDREFLLLYWRGSLFSFFDADEEKKNDYGGIRYRGSREKTKFGDFFLRWWNNKSKFFFLARRKLQESSVEIEFKSRRFIAVFFSGEMEENFSYPRGRIKNFSAKVNATR